MGVYRKFPELQNFSYFLQSDVYETLAPAVSDYEDSKSESWHHAKKIREVNSVNKPTRTLLFVVKKSCLFWPPVKNKNKINYKTLRAVKTCKGCKHSTQHL